MEGGALCQKRALPVSVAARGGGDAGRAPLAYTDLRRMREPVMSDARFDVVFRGELLPGFAADAVAAGLAALFKAPPETVARLLAGGTSVLKRGADEATARKYVQALERVGAHAELRAAAAPAAGTAEAADQAPVAAPAAPVATAPAASVAVPAAAAIAPTSDFTLAPPGSAVLLPEERVQIDAVQVETGHLSLAADAGQASAAPALPIAAPDTSHITIAEVGADLGPGPRAAPPPAPDTSAFSLADVGTTLAPPAPPAPAAPDVSALTLAPPGAPLEELRVARAPLAPDTSALQLVP